VHLARHSFPTRRSSDLDDVRRVGRRNWRCTVAHLSLGNFGADLFYSTGGGSYGQRWAMEPTNGSPIGSTSAATYFHQDRGRQTLDRKSTRLNSSHVKIS